MEPLFKCHYFISHFVDDLFNYLFTIFTIILIDLKYFSFILNVYKNIRISRLCLQFYTIVERLADKNTYIITVNLFITVKTEKNTTTVCLLK